MKNSKNKNGANTVQHIAKMFIAGCKTIMTILLGP